MTPEYEFDLTEAPSEALDGVAGMLSVSALAIKYLLDKPYRTHQFLDFVRALPSHGNDDSTDGQLIGNMEEALQMAISAVVRAHEHAAVSFMNEVIKEAANGSNKRGKDADS